MANRALRSLSTVALAGLLVAGCTGDRAETDYRQKYPVHVHAETAILTARLSDEPGLLVPEDEFRLSRLVAGYLERGHGPMFVSAASPRHGEALRLRLMAAGIPASALAVVPTERGVPDSVTFRYDRFHVTVPTCGDWSSNPSVNPSNDLHSNFGCDLQRDFGLMVADPADLVRMRDALPTDAQNSSRVLQKYRAGLPPAAVPTPLQQSGAAGTAPVK
jgi:pilus biogenesis lipoprotein CpaD